MLCNTNRSPHRKRHSPKTKTRETRSCLASFIADHLCATNTLSSFLLASWVWPTKNASAALCSYLIGKPIKPLVQLAREKRLPFAVCSAGITFHCEACLVSFHLRSEQSRRCRIELLGAGDSEFVREHPQIPVGGWATAGRGRQSAGGRPPHSPVWWTVFHTLVRFQITCALPRRTSTTSTSRGSSCGTWSRAPCCSRWRSPSTPQVLTVKSSFCVCESSPTTERESLLIGDQSLLGRFVSWTTTFLLFA